MDFNDAIIKRLHYTDVILLARGVKIARRVEQKYRRRFEQIFNDLSESAAYRIVHELPPPNAPDFEWLLILHAYESMLAGMNTQPRVDPLAAKRTSVKLGKPKPFKIPSNPAELRIWWDMVQNRRITIPTAIKAQAKRIKAEYLKTVQSIWQKASEDFREGRKWTQADAKSATQRIVQVGTKRANVIVNTETTRYYNEVRVKYYGEQPTVTHFLFIAARDKYTTPWCKTRRGLVYKKNSTLFKRETPPIHWNCRSEMVPLSRFNPVHRKLIDDANLARENHSPEPLPKGWNK